MTSKSFDLETFTFNGHMLRTVVIDGKPWFVFGDVLLCMGITRSGATYRAVPETERAQIKRQSLTNEHPSRGRGQVNIITEPALYSLVLRAQRSNPAARDFQDWVTKEVLPRIRKDGAYFKDEEKVETGEVTAKVVQENLWMLWAATLEAVRENFFAPLLGPLLSPSRCRSRIS